MGCEGRDLSFPPYLCHHLITSQRVYLTMTGISGTATSGPSTSSTFLLCLTSIPAAKNPSYKPILGTYMNKILVLLAMLVSVNAYAKNEFKPQSYVKYGVGVFSSAKDSNVEVKTVAVGRQAPLGSWFIWQWELGVWSDSRQDIGRASSGIASVSMGINVDAGYFYCQSLWGIAGITTPDAYLGAPAQFHQDLSCGIKNRQGMSFGPNYSHDSSGGIFMPNVGRDFGTIRLAIPL